MNSSQSPQKKKNQLDIMKQLCVSRRKENFQNLKQWDQARAAKLTLHRKIVDQIDQILQIKVAQSNEYVRVVKQFFTQLLIQKNRYASQPPQDPEVKFLMNLTSKNIYKNSSRFLGKLYQSQNKNNLKSYRIMKTILEQSLNNIDQFLLQSERQLMELKTKLELTILEVQNSNLKTIQKCDNLVQIYNGLSKNLKAFQSQQDFYIEQDYFLKAAHEQLQSERFLGQRIVEYLQYVQDRQIQKLQILKQLIGKYVECVSENQQNSHFFNSLKDILKKRTQTDYFTIYFSPEELILKPLLIQLAKIQNKHQKQITIKYLKTFLTNFEYQNFDNRNLILKSLKCYIKKNEELQPIKIIITVQGFINIYHSQNINMSPISNKNQNNSNMIIQVKKTFYSLKIGNSLQLQRNGDIELVIVVKTWGIMNLVTQGEEISLQVIFNSEDQRQEFYEFIQQLK